MSERILIVRLGAMGDIIHTLPAVVSLRRSFPDATLTWAVEEKWAPLLEGVSVVDRLEYVDRRSFAAVLRLRRNLRAGGITLAVDFQGLIKSAVVCFLARPDRIVGLDRTVARESLAALFYSRPVIPHCEHIVDRQLELAAAAGATSHGIAFPIPAGAPEGSLPESPFVLANPQAGWVSKQWPLEYYSEIGRRLQDRGFTLVLNAASEISAPHTVPHVSGLPGLIDATRRASAVLGVDSGPLHLGAALGKPGVAVFGPTDPARNGPYGGTIRVLRSTAAVTTYKRGAIIDPSMRAVTPDQVWTALEPQL
jgi:heptosyltransferase-1